MNDSFGGDFNATQTASGSGGAASEQKAEGVAPVFIRQLLNSKETTFTMFGMSFGMVCATAIIRSIEPSSTKITYLLEDHTGRIEGHYWLEDGDDADKLSPDIMLNNYATIYGCLRSQGEQKTLMIFKLIPVSDPNAVCTHALEVLNARFKAEDYSKKSNEQFEGSGSSLGAVGGASSIQSAIASGLDSKHRLIFQAIKESRTADGISRDELTAKFRHMRPDEINSILDFLVSEGHIYSSSDPNHFVSTE